MLSFSLLVSGMAPVPGDKNKCVRAAHILSLPLCPSALARHAPATRKNVCACVSAHMHSLCSPSPRARRDTTLATPRAPPALPLCPATLKRAARPPDRLLCGRSTICSSTSATASSPSKSARTSTTSTSGPRRASSRAPAMGTASAATTRPATTSEHRPAKPTPPRPPPPAPSALTGPRHPSRAGATVRSPRTSAPTACGPRRARGASGPSRTDPRAATT